MREIEELRAEIKRLSDAIDQLRLTIFPKQYPHGPWPVQPLPMRSLVRDERSSSGWRVNQ